MFYIYVVDYEERRRSAPPRAGEGGNVINAITASATRRKTDTSTTSEKT